MTARATFRSGAPLDAETEPNDISADPVPPSVPFRALTSAEGLAEIDTGRWRYVPPESTDAEERRRLAVRALLADHVRLERTKGRRLVAYLVVLAIVSGLTLYASHQHPEPWGYGWSVR